MNYNNTFFYKDFCLSLQIKIYLEISYANPENEKQMWRRKKIHTSNLWCDSMQQYFALSKNSHLYIDRIIVLRFCTIRWIGANSITKVTNIWETKSSPFWMETGNNISFVDLNLNYIYTISSGKTDKIAKSKKQFRLENHHFFR